MKSILFILSILTISGISVFSQGNEASLILDLKKARASFEMSKQKFENNKKLFDNKAISEDEFTRSKNELLGIEVDYQKMILQLVAQQSYIIVEKAIKYQDTDGNKKIRITLRSTMEGNQEYINQFKEHFDIFTPEMRSNKVYNVFVSIVSIQDQTIIGTPYEVRVPAIELGSTTTVNFELLKDLESVQVVLNYGGRVDKKSIYLQKGTGIDGTTNSLSFTSNQFSQEANLGSQAAYDLNLERFSSSDDVYQLIVLNLPKQISAEFYDADTRLSQLKFNQGVNTRKLILKTFLPDGNDEEVIIDKPIEFYVLAVTKTVLDKIGDQNKLFTEQEFQNIAGGKIALELIPRGVGQIEIRAPNLYHEIKIGDQVNMKITIVNNGTRRLDNVKITTDNPMNWQSSIRPDVIKSLDPAKEQIVEISLIPPDDVNIGAQEVKIKTKASVNNLPIESEDKTIRIQVESKSAIMGTLILIMLLVGVIVGIVIFGIKISKR